MDYCIYCMMPVEKTDIECPFCGKELSNEVPAHHLKPGTVLNKKYIVGAALGEGGFGITYIGRDLTLDIRVAIKEYFPNGYVNRSNTVSPEIICSLSKEKKDFFSKGCERFLKEARILAKFSGDPGIVEVRDFFEENNTAYIVMEYLDGQDLKEYLKQHGTLTAEKTVTLLMPVMKSLIKIHRQGLIHRDISPDNIRLIKNCAKLIDFGAARDISAYANKSLSVMLKPGYAPEEQYRSKGNQGPWTDVYALCATMYKCITGVTPDDATQRVFNDEVKTPSALGVRIDKTIENAIMKGLSVLQKDRYQTVEELINGLNGINISSKSDEKTVYSGKSVSEDDKETKFIPNTEDDILTQQNQETNESTESKSESVVVSDADKKEKAEIKPKPEPSPKNEEDNIARKNSTDVSNKVEDTDKKNRNAKERIRTEITDSSEKNSNKAIVITILATVIAIIILVVIFISISSDKSSDNVTDTNITTVNTETTLPETTIIETTATVFSNEEISAYENGIGFLSSYIDSGNDSDREKAKEQFEIAGRYENSEDYINVLNACVKEDAGEAVSILEEYADDEYVQKILLSEKYIYAFFKNTLWVGDKDNNTDPKYFLTFDENCESDYNLPSFGHKNNDGTVQYYQFVDGIYITVDNDNTELQYWKFNIISRNEISVYCYDGGTMLYLKRSS